MAQRRVAGLDPQFTMDEAGNLYESGTLVANNGAWEMDEGNNLTVNGQGYGANARADALREQGYLPVESIGRLDPSQFNWAALDQQLGLTPVIGPSGERMLSAADRTKVNEWGTQQGILQDSGGFGDFLQEAAVKIGPIIAAIAGVPGLTPGLGDIVSGAAGAAGAAGAGGATGAFDAFGALNSPTGLGAAGTVFDAAGGAGLGSALLDPSLIQSPVAPVSTGAAYGTVDPFLQGVTQTMPATLGASTAAGSTLGTAAPFTSGLGAATGPAAAAALGAWEAGAPSLLQSLIPTPAQAATSAATTAATQAMPTLDGEGGMVPGEYKDLGGSYGILDQLKGLVNGLPGGADMWGKLLATGLGGIGASQQASASSELAKQFMDLGKPYRDSLASLEANPASYYQSPEVQGALQQGSDSLARSLSAKVGNPILNPTALQEMQNYSTNGLLGQLNQRRNFLAGAGGLGVGQAAQLGTNAVQSSGGVYNALGAGLGTVFGNQKDYASELLDILKNRGGSSGMSLS